MIDIGVNLLHPQFDADREAVLARAWQAGLSHIIITGVDLPGSAAGCDWIADSREERLSATAGIHPHHAGEAPPGWQQALATLARRPEVCALGETGLDFHRNYAPRADQERVFRDQLALAADLDLPMFVHDRDAGETVARCLARAPAVNAVVHCFTGSRDDLLRYLELGCHIGVTGWVCDRRRGQELRDLIPSIPLERLMIETDAPFLRPQNAPADRHGRRNEPALLGFVARRLADLYGITEDALAAATTANARRFFRMKPRDEAGSSR